MTNAWLNWPMPRRQAAARLFCFPYAGAGASIFRLWPAALPSDVDLCAIQLPGRAQRLNEAALTSLPALIDAVVEAVSAHLDVPFAFFGHSMGAVLASEVARELEARGLPVPGHLIVSARRPPSVPDIAPPLGGLPDGEFVAEINRRYGGIPEEILQNPEILELLLPTLRADIAALETYAPARTAPLPCAITALGGVEDRLTPRSHVEAWGRETTGPFKLRLFPGGHFFIEAQRAGVLAEVSTAVQSLRETVRERRAAE